VNFEGVVGAVGFIPLNFPKFYPVSLIKVDEDGEPIRGRDGLCIRCKPREPGMFIGLIDRGNPLRNFDGYADKNATKKKVARDVFRRGDAAFLSGDILEMDELGYLYFKDRTGDTFRWRGENVSTTEVEAVISNVAGLKDCVVYGVEVIQRRADRFIFTDDKFWKLNRPGSRLGRQGRNGSHFGSGRLFGREELGPRTGQSSADLRTSLVHPRGGHHRLDWNLQTA
jgi:acyl-CoA synthetase (AMP-forming)/AMP-acid ligase II